VDALRIGAAELIGGEQTLQGGCGGGTDELAADFDAGERGLLDDDDPLARPRERDGGGGPG